MTYKKEQIYVWDGINNNLEEMDSIEDAKTYIKEVFIESGEIHPDIESVFIVKRIAQVHIEETEEKTELNGELVPVCKVTIE